MWSDAARTLKGRARRPASRSRVQDPARGRRAAGVVLVLLSLAAAALAGCGGKEPARPAVGAVSADSLYAWLSGGRKVVLLDARPDSVFDRGHVPGSVRAHGKAIPELRDVLPFGPDVPIVVVEGDSTANSLAARLAAYGFPYVLQLARGAVGWREQGYQLDGYRTLPR
jgi:rhodanese-related sulfurtransferase